MTAINMPSNQNFVNCQFYLQAHTQTFTSPLANVVQRQELDGARWMATYSLPAMQRAKAAEWRVFFMLLRGSVNTFNAYDPDNLYPRGLAGGTPLVAGASQTGVTLNIDGCTPSALFLRAGDYFNVNSELKCITSDATADGSGNVTLNFQPYLHSSPADNAVITTSNCTCTMVRSDDSQAAFDVNANGIYMPKTFTAYEVF
jgi:hypothetical protein